MTVSAHTHNAPLDPPDPEDHPFDKMHEWEVKEAYIAFMEDREQRRDEVFMQFLSFVEKRERKPTTYIDEE